MRLFLVVLSCFIAACTNNAIPKATVMITNLAENSGGSGTILRSDALFSEILTNAHVCGVVKGGGIISSTQGKSYAVGYKTSTHHDLCLISVTPSLHINTPLALEEPKPFSPSLASGHPRLLPTMMTPGYFSHHLLVNIMTGKKACTDADFENPATTFLCVFLGGIPVMTSYDSVVTSSLIQPGSSGSAVYTSSGTIGAVIFAGSGDLGWGLAVPLPYVKLFVDSESRDMQYTLVDMSYTYGAKSQSENVRTKLKDICENVTSQEQKNTCNFYLESTRYNDLLMR